MFDKIIEAARQRHIARLLAEETAHEEQTYTQEEVLELLHKRMLYSLGNDYQESTTTKWFEQVKKK
jgi:hypothetical protein